MPINDVAYDNIDKVNMSLPCKSEYIGVVRLTVSAIANRMGFNIEEIEDIKVAVSEGCANAVKHALDTYFDIAVEVFSNKIKIEIKDCGVGYDVTTIQVPDMDSPKEGGLGIFIIKTLMDQAQLESKVGKGSKVTMVKFLENI